MKEITALVERLRNWADAIEPKWHPSAGVWLNDPDPRVVTLREADTTIEALIKSRADMTSDERESVDTMPYAGIASTEIWRNALEAAAGWHDERARNTPDAFEMEFHQVSAKAIRALSGAATREPDTRPEGT